ncbi:MAG: ribonuclease III [Oscillospiraceae bacterium]|nr:ribonuclease III [Oscillospiraceae bacterium]
MTGCKLCILQEKIGYRFNEINFLRQALTHKSYTNEHEHNRAASYERLEFLGDSLLGAIVSVLIFNHKPALTEGEMSKLRAKIICEKSLSSLALELDIGPYMLLSRGEIVGGGHRRPSILADVFEAVIAAIFLDGGMEPTVKFVTNIFAPLINKSSGKNSDYKSMLQEHIQTKPNLTLEYKTVGEEGPDHNKTFTVEVSVGGQVKGKGTGKSKKAAEQAAAKQAILTMKEKV